MGEPTFVHETADVDPSASLGDGVRVWNWTKVRERARIGEGTVIGQGVYVDRDVVIGKDCKIQNGVSVYYGVTLGDGVFVGPHATFTNDPEPRAVSPDWKVVRTDVHEGASIGANATIVCGVTLGAYCMVGAGAVVTRDVADHSLVVGVPAVAIDVVDDDGKRLYRDLGAQ